MIRRNVLADPPIDLARTVACIAVACCTAAAKTPPPKLAFEATHLASISVGGENVLADGRLRVQKAVFRKADGSSYGADLRTKPAGSRQGPRVEAKYAWGTVACEYAAAPGRLDLTIRVANAAKDTLDEVWLRPLAIRLPDKAKISRPQHNIGSPSVLTAAWETGVLALCNLQIDRPLHLVLTKPRNGSAGVEVRAGGGRMLYDELTMRRPIPPGKSDTYALSLRFGPAGSDPHDLAADVYRTFAAAHPSALHWPDRRPIVRLFIGGGLSEARVLAHYRRGAKGPLPAASETFGEKILDKLAHGIYAAKEIDAQGIVVWDIEGDAVPAITYVGDPRLAATLYPDMDAAADAYFAKIRQAKLRCGVCIRPSHVVYAKDKGRMMQSFGAAKDPFLELDAKVVYAKKRWGCTMFYIDTNYFWRPRGEGGKWTPGMLAADVWKRLLAKHPKVLFIPEHNYVEYWATTAPYNELDCGYRGIPAWVRRVYPKAFCVPVIEDADPHENWELIVRLVREGDCLMTFIYGLTRNARAIRSAYAEAKLLDAGPPPAVKGAKPDALAALTKDADLRTRFFAVRAMGPVKAPGGVAALLAAAGKADEHWLVRKEAIRSLGRLKAAAATQPLGRLLTDKKADLAHFVTLALKEISKVATPSGLDPAGGDEPAVEPLGEP